MQPPSVAVGVGYPLIAVVSLYMRASGPSACCARRGAGGCRWFAPSCGDLSSPQSFSTAALRCICIPPLTLRTFTQQLAPPLVAVLVATPSVAAQPSPPSPTTRRRYWAGQYGQITGASHDAALSVAGLPPRISALVKAAVGRGGIRGRTITVMCGDISHLPSPFRGVVK